MDIYYRLMILFIIGIGLCIISGQRRELLLQLLTYIIIGSVILYFAPILYHFFNKIIQ